MTVDKSSEIQLKIRSTHFDDNFGINTNDVATHLLQAI